MQGPQVIYVCRLVLSKLCIWDTSGTSIALIPLHVIHELHGNVTVYGFFTDTPHKVNCDYVLTSPLLKSSVTRRISNCNIRNSPKATTDKLPLDDAATLFISRHNGEGPHPENPRVRRIPPIPKPHGNQFTIAARRP